MTDRRSSHHHHSRHSRQTFEEKYRVLEDELKRKNDSLRYSIFHLNIFYSFMNYDKIIRNESIDQHNLSHSSYMTNDQSVKVIFFFFLYLVFLFYVEVCSS